MVIESKMQNKEKDKQDKEISPEMQALIQELQFKGQYWSEKYMGVFNPGNTQIGEDKFITLNLLFGIFSELLDIKEELRGKNGKA